MESTGKVVVVGSVNLDLCFYVDRIPKIGETTAASKLLYSLGGKGANQAIAASNLGGSVLFVATVGQDSNAHLVKEYLLDHGLGLEFVMVLPEAETGVASITVDADGENVVTVALGANLRMAQGHVNSVPFEKHDVLLTQLEVSQEAVLSCLRRAASLGLTSILNAAPITSWAREACNNANIVILNEGELVELTGQAAQEDIEISARSLRASTDQIIVVTLGGDGVFALVDDRSIRVASHKVRVRDTTGAGDCFVGAFASGIAHGYPLEDSLVFANAAAGVSVQRFGTATSMPSQEDVEYLVRG